MKQKLECDAMGLGGLADAKIFLRMMCSPAFSKTLALLRSSPLERDLVSVNHSEGFLADPIGAADWPTKSVGKTMNHIVFHL